MDTKITITSEQEGEGFYVAQFKTAELAVYTYYVESQGQALIIDPTYDTRTFKEFIDQRKSHLKFCVLTHYHADFVSGQAEFQGSVIMGPCGKVADSKFEVKQYADGSAFQLGKVKVQVIHTPGHSDESSCFLLVDAKDVPSCIFTGDTLLVNDVGRPDFPVKEEGIVEGQEGRHFDSLQKIKSLDGKVRVYPCHGNGSSCGKSIGASNFCDIATQKDKNALFKETKKEEFVKNVCSNISSGKYWSHVLRLNKLGTDLFEKTLSGSNQALSVEQFQTLYQKMIVIDTRIEPESIISGKNVFWLTAKGTLAGWAANLVLPNPSAEFILFTQKGKLQEVSERLFRVGLFNIKGYNNFTMDQWKGQSWRPKIAKFDQLKDIKDAKYFDCRNKPEWKLTGIIEKAILIPLPQVLLKVADLKDEKNLVIHCRTGMRARVAASILAQHGIQSTVLAETVDHFKQKGPFKMIPFEQ